LNAFGKSRQLPADDDRVIGMRDLPYYGINYHPNHLRRMWERGEFPRPSLLTPRKLSWTESQLREFFERSPERRAAAQWRGKVIEACREISNARVRESLRADARNRLAKMGLTEARAAEIAQWDLEQTVAHLSRMAEA
jgi:hypothetical protein